MRDDSGMNEKPVLVCVRVDFVPEAGLKIQIAIFKPVSHCKFFIHTHTKELAVIRKEYYATHTVHLYER